MNAASEHHRDDLDTAATRAEKEDRWIDATALWREYLETFPEDYKKLSKYGNALSKLNLHEEALEIYELLRLSDPASLKAFVGTAKVAERMRNYPLALATFDKIKSDLPEEWNAGWEARRSYSLLKLGRIREAEEVFTALARDQPNDPSGLLGLAASADLKRDRKTAQALWKQIEQTYPNDPRTRAGRIKHELKRGAVDEVAGLLEDRGDLHPVEHAIVEAELDFVHLRYAKALARLADARAEGLEPERLWAKELSFRERSILTPADREQLTVAAAQAVAGSPDARELREANARALIFGEKRREALGAVAALNAESETSRAGLLLASWAAHMSGDVETSVSRTRQALEQGFVASLHAPAGTLVPAGPERLGRARPDLTIFTCVKNEADYLPWFFGYYRALGVETFFVIDNGSTDGTREILQAQPDVTLFDARGDFFAAGGGMRWINELSAGHAGKWSIYVDTDEMLIYPGSETRPLSAFLADVEDAGQEAVAAFMVDMYSDTSFALRPGPIADPLSLTPCYDRDYFRFGSPEFPFFEIGGGPRSRLFGTSERLRKVPIVRGGQDIAYLNSHATIPARLGPHATLILHFKLIRYAQVAEGSQDQSRVVSRSQGAIVRHSLYEKMYRHESIRFAGTTRYAASTDPDVGRLFDLVRAPERADSIV